MHYHSNDIKIYNNYEITDKINYNYFIMNSKYVTIFKGFLLSRALEFEKKLTVTGSVKRQAHAHRNL